MYVLPILIGARAGGHWGQRTPRNEKMNVFGQKIDAIRAKINRMNCFLTTYSSGLLNLLFQK